MVKKLSLSEAQLAASGALPQQQLPVVHESFKTVTRRLSYYADTPEKARALDVLSRWATASEDEKNFVRLLAEDDGARSSSVNTLTNKETKKVAEKQTKPAPVIETSRGGNSPILNPRPTPEQIDNMTMEEVGEALEKASSKSVKPQPPEFKLVDINSEEDITLADLIGLDDTPLPFAKMVMRQLNTEHTEHLQAAYEHDVETGEDTLPPITVAGSTWGVIIVDGYHRQAAMERLLKEQFVDEDGKIPDEQKQEYQQARATTSVNFKAVNGLTERQLLKMACDANYTNGLPVSTANRSRHAILFIEWAKEDGKKLSVQDAAKMVGVSRIAVHRQIQRDRMKSEKGTIIHKQPADYVEPEDVEELEDTLIEDQSKHQTDALRSAATRLLSAVRAVFQELQDSQEIADYLSKLVKDEDTLLACDTVGIALSALESAEQPATK